MLPVAVLREQVAKIHAQRRACQFAEVATDLPGLIRNLHTTLATGADHGAVLDLAVYLHVHVIRLWLSRVAAPGDLIRRTVFLAQRLAQQRDEFTTLGVAGFGVADTLLSDGAFELGRAVLDSITVPTTADTAGLVCQLTMIRAYAAVLDRRPGEIAAPMDAATELAERFGAASDTDSLGFEHASADLGLHRVSLTLEAGEPDQAVSTARDVHPEGHPYLVGSGPLLDVLRPCAGPAAGAP